MTTIPPLSKLERVPVREAWKHEASDFTPWLAEDDNLQALAEALVISELELVATEHQVAFLKLDILCTDGDQHVVIETSWRRPITGIWGRFWPMPWGFKVMPELTRFFGIIIAMVYNDHAPPHFHAN